MSSPSPLIFPIIVAAGVGKRFGGEIPKQYTLIHGKTVLEHSVNAIMQVKNLQLLRVVVSSEDAFAKNLMLSTPIEWIVGGKERMHSVFNAVDAIWKASLEDNHNNINNRWVLIHDAARPCIFPMDVEKLISQVSSNEVGLTSGGILAVRVRDTVKESHTADGKNYASITIDRNRLWLAQTPQLFPLEPLYQHLSQAIEQNIPFTDEASLFEHFGKTPLLVEGSHSNIKLTFPEDVLWANMVLKS